MGLPLASFPIASTRDPDEAQSILSRQLAGLRFEKVRDRRAFRLDMNGIRLGRTLVAYNRFETDTSIQVRDVAGAYILVLGVGPPATFNIDGEPVVCADRAAIISSARRLSIERPAGSGLFIIRAEVPAVEKRLREVTEMLPGKPLVLDRSVNLLSGVGAQASRLLSYLVDCLHQDCTIADNPLLQADFEDSLLNTLLALPGNYSDHLMGGPRPDAAPWVVRRAEEYLDAHAAEPITISDVVTECGCGRRALFSAFRRFRGYTPMDYLAEARLRSAREALEDPSPEDSVTSVAYACGFSHLGRFSQKYLARFGEHPSESLRKARS